MSGAEQFSSFIRGLGYEPPARIEPGRFIRFGTSGKRGDHAGYAKLFPDGAGGIVGDFRTGRFDVWRGGNRRPVNESERRAWQQTIEREKREAEAEHEREASDAASRANNIWENATGADDAHRYLQAKRIGAYGLRLHKGTLVVPLRDATGLLTSLQFIGEDGRKVFLRGGRKRGCYFGIGKPGTVLCIAEGFATAASIHEATGYAVAVAFDAGNLEPVARALRSKYPEVRLILCADDDAATTGNPGNIKATAAAQAVGGLLAVPDFGEDRPAGGSDFNDMAKARGQEAVKRAIASAAVTLDYGVTGVTGVQASNGAGFPVTPDDAQGVTGVTQEAEQTIPEHKDRPCFRVFDNSVALPGGGELRDGVWYFGIKAGRKLDDPSTLTDQWICSPLHLEAVTVDEQDYNYGRLLRFRNTLGRWREWAMPMELLRGAGDELRGELLAMGAEIDPPAKTLLANYLQAKPPKRQMRCALQVGWCGDSFVLPDVVIGPKASGVIFQSGERGHDEHTMAGTLTGWQVEIAARAVGNPLLTLALSASFAGPMLGRCNVEGGGVHFVGDSSTGKTTLIEASCSTWGGPNFRRSWRATANGMEGAAALFNDCLLALDEISECDPREVGAIVYALGNGRGKQRATRYGNARSVTRWRCFILSSGERTIATAMQEGGYRSKAGQAVRLLDIPTARAFGTWDDLHGEASGAAFADAVKRAAVTHYGHAGRAFLEKLTRDGRDFCALLERIKVLPEFGTDDGEGQDKRAAARFALLALAGEVATEYGITGWQEGAAINAAAEGFKAWLGLRGRGNDERRQILERVSAFIERHGDARFSDADKNDDGQTRDRAGWWRDAHEGRTYLFTKDGMREAVKGFDLKRALDALQEAGALPAPGADGKRSRSQRLGGRPVRVYPIISDKLGAENGA